MGDNNVIAMSHIHPLHSRGLEFPTKTTVLMVGRAFNFKFRGFCWFVS